VGRGHAVELRLRKGSTGAAPLAPPPALAAFRRDLIAGAFARKYRADQPRVPAGASDGGQWTNGGGGTGRNDPRVLSDATPDNTAIPGARYAANESERRYSVDVKEQDARGGHTERDHVKREPEALLQNLRDNWSRWTMAGVEVTYFKPAMGSFTSLIAANDFVNQTLRENRETVDLVASGQRSEAILEKRFGYATGYEAFRRNGDSEPYIRDAYGVRVLIRHDPFSDRGYRVHTAFPINEYVTRK
jgi:hypothetical protein